MAWNPSGKPQELRGMAVAKCDRDTVMMALLRQRPARSGRISAE